MAETPNFILVPDPDPEVDPPTSRAPATLGHRLMRAVSALTSAVSPTRRLPPSAPSSTPPRRPRLVFGFDATASREPAWATARQVTDALVRALPGELDVALAVHGGSVLHTFTEFTANPNSLRDHAAAIGCRSGRTQLLPILSPALAASGVRVVTYIGDVYEESPRHGRELADEMGRRSIRLIVLHDVADWNARRDAELFLDLARRTGGCVLPFDANSPDRLRELLAAVAVFAVGGARLLHKKRRDLPGAVVLLKHLARE